MSTSKSGEHVSLRCEFLVWPVVVSRCVLPTRVVSTESPCVLEVTPLGFPGVFCPPPVFCGQATRSTTRGTTRCLLVVCVTLRSSFAGWTCALGVGAHATATSNSHELVSSRHLIFHRSTIASRVKSIETHFPRPILRLKWRSGVQFLDGDCDCEPRDPHEILDFLQCGVFKIPSNVAFTFLFNCGFGRRLWPQGRVAPRGFSPHLLG